MAPRVRALLPVLLLAVAVPAVAGVPSPFNSTVPACMAACPMGDIPFQVIVRDLANNPVAGSSVMLDFGTCPGAYLCTTPPPPYDQDVANRRILGVTDGNGVVSFPLHVGGTCGAGGVRIYADGVFLSSVALASPDQTGNGMVVCVAIDTDCAVFGAKVGGTDPTADFDCDGDVDAVDQFTFNQHVSHACEGFVDPVRRSNWGRLKAHYR